MNVVVPGGSDVKNGRQYFVTLSMEQAAVTGRTRRPDGTFLVGRYERDKQLDPYRRLEFGGKVH
jgi:hypothetical protein